MTTYTIGMKIKSYDFPNNESCFMVGEITNICKGLLYCSTVSTVREGAEISNQPETFVTAIESMFDDMFPNFKRLVVLG